MPNSRRRGKWQPFDALEGYQRSLRQIEYEKNKRPKPILSEDALEDLNNTLIYALNTGQEVVVEYYQNGYHQNFKGLIKEVNPTEGILKISNKVLKLSLITKISLTQ